MGVYSVLRSALWRVRKYPADRCARLLEESQGWPRHRLESYRDEKIRRLIKHCYENVPYYRKVMEDRGLGSGDVQGLEDLTKLPILTKDIIRQEGSRLLSANVSTMQTSWTRTGGTTGQRIQVCKDIDCAAWSGMCYERGLTWGGKAVEEPAVFITGGTLGIDRTSLSNRVGKRLRGDVFIPAYELRADNAAVHFELIDRSHCRYVIGYASSIYRLATLAQETGRKVEFAAAFPTAEMLLPHWEEVIHDTFNCSVLPFYGCGEVNSLGFSASGCKGYLIPEEHALMELCHGDGSTALYGEGKFLVTDLDNYAMPIIRYMNGDAGEISAYNGHLPYSRIERLDGRCNSFLMTEEGALISGIIGVSVFRFTSSVMSYRIVQEEPLRLVVKVVPKNKLTEEDDRTIKTLLKKYLGKGMQVNIEEVSSIPSTESGKSVFVINQCLQ